MSEKMYKNYVRYLELFAALHEEVGEAQKTFNDIVWKGGRISSEPKHGNPNHRDNFVTNVDLSGELNDIQTVLDEMKDTVFNIMSSDAIPDAGKVNL